MRAEGFFFNQRYRDRQCSGIKVSDKLLRFSSRKIYADDRLPLFYLLANDWYGNRYAVEKNRNRLSDVIFCYLREKIAPFVVEIKADSRFQSRLIIFQSCFL